MLFHNGPKPNKERLNEVNNGSGNEKEISNLSAQAQQEFQQQSRLSQVCATAPNKKPKSFWRRFMNCCGSG